MLCVSTFARSPLSAFPSGEPGRPSLSSFLASVGECVRLSQLLWAVAAMVIVVTVVMAVMAVMAVMTVMVVTAVTGYDVDDGDSRRPGGR